MLARWLISAGHEIAIIERSTNVCEAIEEELGSVTVLGDGTEAGVLAKAGANRAAVLIAATGMDDANLVACQLARHRFSVGRTITLIKNPEYQQLFERLGIGTIINTTDIIVGNIQEALSDTLVEQRGEPG